MLAERGFGLADKLDRAAEPADDVCEGGGQFGAAVDVKRSRIRREEARDRFKETNEYRGLSRLVDLATEDAVDQARADLETAFRRFAPKEIEDYKRAVRNLYGRRSYDDEADDEKPPLSSATQQADTAATESDSDSINSIIGEVESFFLKF